MNNPVKSSSVPSRSFQTASDVFLEKARSLYLASLRHWDRGEYAEALEAAYQAALRLAGARVESARKKKARPTGAWERLKLLDEDGKARAVEFSQYSRIRARVLNGIEENVSAHVVRNLIDSVASFLDEVEGERGWLTPAA